MRIKWGHLCQEARYDHPMWSFEGMFDCFTVPTGGGPTSAFTLVMAIEAERGEDAEGQTFDVEIHDSSGKFVSAHRRVPAQWRDLGSNYPKLCTFGFHVPALPLPGPGRFVVTATVNGQPVRDNIEFFATTPEGRLPANMGEPLPAYGTAIIWGHLCFEIGKSSVGFPSIRQAIDFFPVPPGKEPVFSGAFVYQLSLGPRAGENHRALVEFIGVGDNVIRRFDEHDIVALSAGAGQWYRAFCAMTVHDLVIPGPGDYAFRISIDGEFVGSVEFPVIGIDPSKLVKQD